MGYPVIAASFLLLAAVHIAACGSDPPVPGPGPDADLPPRPQPKPGEYGSDCRSDSDCTDTSCIALSTAEEASFCTLRCATDDDCPDDGVSSCLSITNAEGLIQVCMPSDLCIDRDRDGFGEGPGCKGKDCDDDDPTVYPGAPEYCNGKDNNCNGFADDHTVDTGHPCDTGIPGICAEGFTACEQSNVTCLTTVIPGVRPELCDGLDNDCDGLIDEGPDHPEEANGIYVVGIGFPCGTPGDACFRGYQYCDAETHTLQCDGDVEASAVPDLCDGVDNNCDGQIDEDANDPEGLLGTACSAGISICRGTGTWVCDPTDPSAPPVCNAVARPDNAQPEICDYQDNNCDGTIDAPFKNADNKYHTLEHCGFCNNNCLTKWGDPDVLGFNIRCNADLAMPTCEYSCAENRYNLDGATENGCEFEPDLEAIYVATAILGGNNSATCGDFDAPCATITHGIERAHTASRLRVRVAEGVFDEAVELKDGISVLGGHSSVNWLRNPAVNTSTITGLIHDGPHVMNVKAINVTQPTTFSGFSINGGDADAGGNSYVIYVSGASSALRIEDNTILAGRGGAGLPGAAGTNGSVGGDGGDGLDRSNFNTTCTHNSSPPVMAGGTAGASTCGSNTRAGGAGAHVTLCPILDTVSEINEDNGDASPGQGPGGGAAGRSPRHSMKGTISAGNHLCTTSNTTTSSPVPGGNGAHGASGSGGSAAASAVGSIVNDHWRGNASGAGSDGADGSGGGGGGSSEGIVDPGNSAVGTAYHYGPTGGGGGGGGCGATGGQGGLSGGASFGIFITNATGAPTVINNTISRGQGGRGGQGGLGGVGGSGGAGGNGGVMIASSHWSRCGQHAAQGGTGGNGGHGGGGGGGTGGASVGIAIAGVSAPATYQNGNEFPIPETTLTGGQGGPGGGSIAAPGAAGAPGITRNVHAF